MNGVGGGFNAICAICYEDQDPGRELLQTIRSCGHVFHELCLQQWIEFCPHSRTPTCPLCKASCGPGDVHRLFFQSSSAAESPRRNTLRPARAYQSDEDSVPTLKQLLCVMTKAAKDAHARISDLELEALESRERNENLENEVNVRRAAEEALRASLAGALDRLQTATALRESILEKVAAMGKELATHRLATDMDMDEKEMCRVLAGNSGGAAGTGNKDDKIEMLTKALYLRNRDYKSLMRKCQELAAGESRADVRYVRVAKLLKFTRAKLARAKLARAATDGERDCNVTRESSSPQPPHARRTSARIDPISRTPRKLRLSRSEFSSRHEHSATAVELHGSGETRGVEVSNTRLNSDDVILLDDDSEDPPHGVVDDTDSGGPPVEDMRRASAGYDTTAGVRRRSHDAGAGPGSGSHAAQLTTPEVPRAPAVFGILPSRLEIGLGLAAESRTDGPAFAKFSARPCEAPAFIVSGADGRGGRVTVLKPPSVVSAVGARVVEGSRPANRVKPPPRLLGPSGLKIEHFFGRA